MYKKRGNKMERKTFNKETKKENSCDTIVFRLDKDLKKRFLDMCKYQDSTSSQELRKFVKKYLNEHQQQTMKF
jgi:hypothetical protein